MHTVSKGGRKRTEHSFSKPLMVTVGILLFVVGFILTVATIPQDSPSGSSHDLSSGIGQTDSGNSRGLYLLAGTVLSLAGVILATVVPALGFVKGT
jgi:hypothetical protein